MSFPAVVGSQVPRVRHVPSAEHNDGPDAVKLASAYGLVPDPWQELVVTDWLCYKPNGKWAANRLGLAVPRQNGKNGILEVRELYGMILLGERILHTAHEVKTARKAFLRLASFFENTKYPELSGLVKEIRRTNGQEAIFLKQQNDKGEWEDGGSVEFVARSKSSGRGFSVDILVMDEAQELTDEAYEALLPTISASSNPQQIMTGTPPGPKANGEVFSRMRGIGVQGGDPTLSWHEWSCDGDEVDLDDYANWAAANPALGIRLSWEFTDGERQSFSDEGFARERLGMWGGVASTDVIDMRLWADLANENATPPKRVALAFDVAPDRSTASIGIAGKYDNGEWFVACVDNRGGTPSWVAPRIAELVRKQRPIGVALDAAGPAGSILAELQKLKVSADTLGARDLTQGCGTLFDAAQSRKLTHRDQPSLNSALAGASKRPLGDSWAWSRKDSATDISPLVAVTLAMQEYGRLDGKPKRTGVVW